VTRPRLLDQLDAVLDPSCRLLLWVPLPLVAGVGGAAL
jgi:hypothetical protein